MNRPAEPINRETAAQPGTPGIATTPPSRKDRPITVATDLRHREAATAAFVPAARLDQRIAALRETIAAAERKRDGVNAAIASRKSALSRLEAQRVLNASGAATTDHE